MLFSEKRLGLAKVQHYNPLFRYNFSHLSVSSVSGKLFTSFFSVYTGVMNTWWNKIACALTTYARTEIYVIAQAWLFIQGLMTMLLDICPNYEFWSHCINISFPTLFHKEKLLTQHNILKNTYCKTPIIRVLEISRYSCLQRKRENNKHAKNGKWVTCIRAFDVWCENYKHANCLVGRFHENFTPRIICVLQYTGYAQHIRRIFNSLPLPLLPLVYT